jgi:hypothetical protein
MHMDVTTAVLYVVLGAILGAVGQGTRSIVGIKKRSDQAAVKNEEMKEWFDLNRLLFSLIIGAIAGSFAAVFLVGMEIGQEFLLGLIAAGYAGTDFIEGIIETRLPAR